MKPTDGRVQGSAQALHVCFPRKPPLPWEGSGVAKIDNQDAALSQIITPVQKRSAGLQ